jgi:4-amino-4-deoxy-L-arabinose transferase-like glycosyltransferase
MPINPFLLSRFRTLCAFALGAFCLLWGLGSYGLLNNNEGLYAQIAREMLYSGNFILPHLNGVPYIEKPPLLYWLIAFSYRLFGVHETAARLVPAVSGFLTLLLSYQAARRWFSENTAFLAAIILGTSLGYAIFCRMVFFDGLLTCFLTATLLSYFRWEQTQTQRLYLRLSYILLGLAILTKGFIALILVGLVVTVYNLITRKPFKQWWRALDGWGAILFLLITVPWHILAAAQDPQFAWFYFVNEHILRFLGKRQPQDYYRGPFYYYTYRLVLYVWPWCLLFVTFLLKVPGLSQHPSAAFKRFLAIWFWTFLIFFSVSRAKANYYMVTALPPLILLLAAKIEEVQEKHRHLIALCTSAGSLLLMLIAVIGALLKCDCFSWIGFTLPIAVQAFIATLSWPLIIAFILLGLVIGGGVRQSRLSLKGLFLLSGLNSCLTIATAIHTMPVFERLVSARPLIHRLRPNPSTVCLYRDYEKMSSIVFYLGDLSSYLRDLIRPIPLIDSLSQDLLYGQNSGRRPDLFLSLKDPQTTIRCPVIIVLRNRLSEFQSYLPFYKVNDQEENIIVFKKIMYSP